MTLAYILCATQHIFALYKGQNHGALWAASALEIGGGSLT